MNNRAWAVLGHAYGCHVAGMAIRPEALADAAGLDEWVLTTAYQEAVRRQGQGRGAAWVAVSDAIWMTLQAMEDGRLTPVDVAVWRVTSAIARMMAMLSPPSSGDTS